MPNWIILCIHGLSWLLLAEYALGGNRKCRSADEVPTNSTDDDFQGLECPHDPHKPERKFCCYDDEEFDYFCCTYDPEKGFWGNSGLGVRIAIVIFAAVVFVFMPVCMYCRWRRRTSMFFDDQSSCCGNCCGSPSCDCNSSLPSCRCCPLTCDCFTRRRNSRRTRSKSKRGIRKDAGPSITTDITHGHEEDTLHYRPKTPEITYSLFPTGPAYPTRARTQETSLSTPWSDTTESVRISVSPNNQQTNLGEMYPLLPSAATPAAQAADTPLSREGESTSVVSPSAPPAEKEQTIHTDTNLQKFGVPLWSSPPPGQGSENTPKEPPLPKQNLFYPQPGDQTQ